MATTADRILEQFSARPADVVSLLQQFHTAECQSLWADDPRLYRVIGRQLIGAGQATAAFELVQEGLMHHPQDSQLVYLSALALARGRNLTKAEEYVEELLKTSGLNPAQRVEALSLAGKLKKEHYRSRGLREKLSLALESARLYRSAFEIEGNSFPAINAATMSLLAECPAADVRQLAEAAIDCAGRERQAPGRQNDYWLLATLGEANLLLRDGPEAARWYRAAVEQAGFAIGEIATMRRQVRLLEEFIPEAAPILEILDVGPTIVFTGHMFDRPGRPDGSKARFPPDPRLEASVRQAISGALDELQPAVGYCCGACGSDLLFAELMLERRKEVHLVLPFARNDFYGTSVDFGLAEFADYRRRFDAVAERAQIHYGTEENYLGEAGLFEFVNDFAQGLTLVHAAELDSEPWCLAVLDETSLAGRGGTKQFVERWEAPGRNVRKIDLAKIREAVHPEAPRSLTAPTAAANPKPPQSPREIKCMLFADVKNYSRLTDVQTPAFFLEFLSQVGEVIHQMRRYPAMCNTWGDGLFVVFNDVIDAADFALHLLEQIQRIDFSGLGLPPDMTVRIGLHAGPVYPQWDRLIGRLNFFGTHVNRAARIEPKTPPGCIYASEQFAALLATVDSQDFVCEYVGMHLLGKEHDQFRCRLYRLGRHDE